LAYSSSSSGGSLQVGKHKANHCKAGKARILQELSDWPAMGESENPMLAIVDRLGRLEGLITGLQNIISQNQASTTAFMTRVEALEKRQVELERNMVTTAHIQSLTEKVDSLVTSDASRRGGTDAAKWSITQFAAWAILLVAVLTLIAMVSGKDVTEQRLLHQQTQEKIK
jgi:hypothetical protein